MSTAQPVALSEAASVIDQNSQSTTTSTTTSISTASKHTLSTISPPDTPAAAETSSSNRSSPTAFGPTIKKFRMDSADDNEADFSKPPSKNVQLSVLANGTTVVNTSAKYDRQIRIWGDHGQTALTNGCVYVVGHSMTASEVAKNVSLAGVGSLVFVDIGLTVTPEISARQFLPPLHEFVNQPFCDAMAHWTKLFNPSATISCLRLKSIDELPAIIHQREPLSDNPDTNSHPSCVVICNPDFPYPLEELVEKILPVPVITCSTIGMMGYSRICLPPVYTVVETHPKNSVEDLRLLEPFPGLQALFNSLTFEELNAHERRSVPWPLVVLHFVKKLFPQNDGTYFSSADRNLLKQKIKEMSQCDARAEQAEAAENFVEAVKGINIALSNDSGVPPAVRDILNDANVDESTDTFWLVCAGLRKFIATRSNLKHPLPLRGTIPDITASTERFVALQEAYRRQAEADASAVHHMVLAIAQERNVPKELMPTFATVQLYCRNAAFLRVIRGVSLKNENTPEANDWQHFEPYLALRAVDNFHTSFGRLPTPADKEQLLFHMSKVYGQLPSKLPDLLAELLHCCQSPEVIAPVMGGIISHEIVKLITGQFVSVNNALVFDGRNKSMSCYFIPTCR